MMHYPPFFRRPRLPFRAELLLALGLTFWLTTGCGDGSENSDESEDADGELKERPATFEEQVEFGAALYGEHCAHCHGDSGQGTEDGPQVVGAGALPYAPPEEREVRASNFETALDVFVFASQNMPADDPGVLSDEEMVDVLAFALFANGVSLDEPLGFENAESIVINPAPGE